MLLCLLVFREVSSAARWRAQERVEEKVTLSFCSYVTRRCCSFIEKKERKKENESCDVVIWLAVGLRVDALIAVKFYAGEEGCPCRRQPVGMKVEERCK